MGNRKEDKLLESFGGDMRKNVYSFAFILGLVAFSLFMGTMTIGMTGFLKRSEYAMPAATILWEAAKMTFGGALGVFLWGYVSSKRTTPPPLP